MISLLLFHPQHHTFVLIYMESEHSCSEKRIHHGCRWTWDYPTLHLDTNKSKGITLLLFVRHFTFTLWTWLKTRVKRQLAWRYRNSLFGYTLRHVHRRDYCRNVNRILLISYQFIHYMHFYCNSVKTDIQSHLLTRHQAYISSCNHIY